jgi:hypothetical protein
MHAIKPARLLVMAVVLTAKPLAAKPINGPMIGACIVPTPATIVPRYAWSEGRIAVAIKGETVSPAATVRATIVAVVSGSIIIF